MRFDHQKAFPYPVLRPDIDDFLKAEFQVTVDMKGTKDNKKLEASINVILSSDEIRREIDKENAAISIIFACRETYFREAVTTQKYELKKSFDSALLRGEVTVYPFVVAVKPIKNFTASINKEFRKDKFSYEVGEVLAADEPKVVYIDRELFRPISSIVQLVKNEKLNGFEWQVGLEEHKLQIMLSSEAKEAVDKARNSRRNQVVLLNSLYFGAIVHAIQMLKADQETYEDRRWAQIMRQQCHNAVIDIDAHDAYLIAQKLLNAPLNLANQYVFQEDEQ